MGFLLLFSQFLLILPEFLITNQRRQLIKTLQLQIPQKHELLSTHGKYHIGGNLPPPHTITVPINAHFLLRRNLSKPINNRDKRAKPEPILLAALELVTEFGDVLVSVDALDLVVLD